MTGRECCEELVRHGRVIKYGNGVRLLQENGEESVAIKVNKGRAYWHLVFRGKHRMLPLSKLVWLAHGNSLDALRTIDHIDRNPLNNEIQNLRLATPAEQSQNRANAKTTPEQRRMIRDQFNLGLTTIRGMARDLKLCRETVQDIVRGRYAYDKQLERAG